MFQANSVGLTDRLAVESAEKRRIKNDSMILASGSGFIHGEMSSLGTRNEDLYLKTVKNINFEIFLIHSREEHQMGSWICKYGSLRRISYSYKFGTH